MARSGASSLAWGAFVVFLAVRSAACADEASEAKQAGRSTFVEYFPGTLPLIISAPHGGTLRPDGVADRKFGRVAQDSNTAELAQMLQLDLKSRYGGAPHLIICRLHRLKVDCNRELDEAAQGDPIATQTWRDYQNFIMQARASVAKTFGLGLYIDLHGHRHPEARVELGYLFGPEILASSDAQLDADPDLRVKCSLRELASRTPASFCELIRGASSLGGMLEKRGYPSIPSPTHAAPGAKEEYFFGGYNTLTHGSKDGGHISGLQIECPFKGVRDTLENQKRFSQALTYTLGEYWLAHFQQPLRPSS